MKRIVRVAAHFSSIDFPYVVVIERPHDCVSGVRVCESVLVKARGEELSLTGPEFDGVTEIATGAFTGVVPRQEEESPNRYAARKYDKSILDLRRSQLVWSGACGGLVKVTLPDSVTKIENNAFVEFNKVTIVLGAGMPEMPEKACYRCSAFKIVSKVASTGAGLAQMSLVVNTYATEQPAATPSAAGL